MKYFHDLLGMMGGIVYYASLDNDDLSMATIELESVELTDVNSVESRATLKVTFLVANPGEVTVTVPVITYTLYADGSDIGSGTYSTEDVAMPGRAAFYPDAEIPLKNKLTIVMSEMNETVYERYTILKQVKMTEKDAIKLAKSTGIAS